MKQARNSPACRVERGAGRKFACPPCQRDRWEIRIWRSALFIAALALVLLAAAPLAADAQQPGKIYRLGFLGGPLATSEDIDPTKCPKTGSPNWQAFVAGLRERGYVQGRNLVLECRYTQGREERAPALAADLVSLRPDLMVVAFTANVRAAKQATKSIPIVMANVIDPVGRELVPNLVRPGGNVTGLTLTAGMEMMGKYLQLLKEAVPTASRVAVLMTTRPTPADPGGFMRELEAAAPALSVTLELYRAVEATEFGAVFAAMSEARAQALLVVPHPFAAMHAQRIIALAAQQRLPVVSDRPFIPAGGLLSYDANQSEIWRRVGVYVDRIFKGTQPGDLPVEQPTKFELIINLKAARTFGLTIPQSLLDRADEVIE